MYDSVEAGNLETVVGIADAQPSAFAGSGAARQFPARCNGCGLRRLCIASSLEPEELPQLEAVVSHWRMVHRGEFLFRAGDRFQSLYTVRSGSLKTVASHAGGLEHVTGFFLPGETVGLGAIGEGEYDCDAIALEDSAVCVLPFAPLESLCRDVKSLQQHFHKMLSREILRESKQMILLSGMTSEQRVAAFLINVSCRLQERGYASRDFTLRMTREEIGSYLGIKLETVSRTFSRFQREGLIRVDGKRIELYDLEALAAI
ncbi:helix-turn-helix domain-containing protein [Cupriavidus sp. BIS7]|uniref:helix-turn-helix domain-containing protein n=1 Tax=Cupriavidus sp. BIS7 TaxID=1217718 RepID=UPI0002D753C0|nr:helix-turn-helix domain-containing protein [Cupriavidus sp. BIS7]